MRLAAVHCVVITQLRRCCVIIAKRAPAPTRTRRPAARFPALDRFSFVTFVCVVELYQDDRVCLSVLLPIRFSVSRKKKGWLNKMWTVCVNETYNLLYPVKWEDGMCMYGALYVCDTTFKGKIKVRYRNNVRLYCVLCKLFWNCLFAKPSFIHRVHVWKFVSHDILYYWECIINLCLCSLLCFC